MKIVFGNISVLRFLNDSYIFYDYIFNLSSIVQIGQLLRYLVPPFHQEELDINELDFDYTYANYIFSNPNSFIDLMNVVIPLYEGNDIFILIDTDLEFKNTLTESIMKLLQQRYGIVSNYILSEEDVYTIVDTDFSLEGLYNLDNDKYQYMIMNVERLQKGEDN